MARYLLLLLTILGLMGWPLAAQTKPEDKINLRFDRLQFDDLTWSDSYPSVAGLRGVGGGSAEKWKRLALRANLTHDGKATDSAWLDDLEATWTVVLQGATPEESIRLERAVTYTNLEATSRGKTIYFLAFIPPDLVRRYFPKGLKDEQVMFRLAVKWGGKTREWAWYGNKTLELTQQPTNRELLAWITSERPKTVKHGLLHRLETPWSFASFDQDALPRIVPNAN